MHVKRIHQLIFLNAPSNNGDKRLLRFLDRILHPLERQDFDTRFPASSKFVSNAHPPDSGYGPIAQFHKSTGSWLAGRWAAKEAAKKAWGAQKLGFKDVRVETNEGGEVQIVCCGWTTGGVGQLPKEAEQVGRLSISHDGDFAIATVMATPLQIITTSSHEATSE